MWGGNCCPVHHIHKDIKLVQGLGQSFGHGPQWQDERSPPQRGRIAGFKPSPEAFKTNIKTKVKTQWKPVIEVLFRFMTLPDDGVSFFL